MEDFQTLKILKCFIWFLKPIEDNLSPLPGGNCFEIFLENMKLSISLFRPI